MKKTHFVLFFIAFFALTATAAEQQSITLAGDSLGDTGTQNKVVITLTKFKPGSYSVSGLLYLGPEFKESFPIKGTYYADKGALKATATNPKQIYPLQVDGYLVSSDLYKTRLDVTIKEVIPDSPERIYFNDMITSDDKLPEESVAPSTEAAVTGEKPSEEAVPVIAGNQPSSPETQEQWNGKWKGKEKVTYVMSGVPPQIQEQEFELEVIREGDAVRVIGLGERGKEKVLKLHAKNSNWAKANEELNQSYADGSSTTKGTVVIFINKGRLYFTQRLETVVTAKGMVKNITSDAIGIADRVPSQ